MKAWLISGSSLKSLLIEANSFDEAIAKARKVNKKYCTGKLVERLQYEGKVK